MPELPEVETVVRGLEKQLRGCVIRRVHVLRPLVVKSPLNSFVTFLANKTVQSIVRHGKCIYWSFAEGGHLKIHLGMTGALLFRPKGTSPDSYVRIQFELDHPDFDLVYRDVRQFGRIALTPQPREKKWGPDAWNGSAEEIFSALRRKKGMIKHALMNQNVIAGLGNIYVDETLFGARIHPKKRLERLSDGSLRAVCAEARRVLGESIAAGGTTFRDYVNSEGKRGEYLRKLNVYGQQGKPCPSCRAPIKKTVVAGRGTHFCASCQKK